MFACRRLARRVDKLSRGWRPPRGLRVGGRRTATTAPAAPLPDTPPSYLHFSTRARHLLLCSRESNRSDLRLLCSVFDCCCVCIMYITLPLLLCFANDARVNCRAKRCDDCQLFLFFLRILIHGAQHAVAGRSTHTCCTIVRAFVAPGSRV